MKKLVKHVRRWNIWRKRNYNGAIHKLLVLFGIRHSPTFEWTLLPEEVYTNMFDKKGERK